MENHGRLSSDTSGEVSVDREVEIEGEDGSGYSRDSSFSYAGQSAAVEASTSSAGRSNSSNDQRTKPVQSGKSHKLAILATRLFDEEFPLKKKLKLLNRLATVKDDGTVQFEVPRDIKPQNLDFGTGVVYNESTDKEAVEAPDVKDIPPLQIVMLIVGTRGDVQPFVAIGKRLQTWSRIKGSCHQDPRKFPFSGVN